MDSINFFKGYGRVNPVGLQPPRPARRSILLAVSLSIALLLTLTIGLLLGAAIHHCSAESASLASDSAASIRAICSVTRDPDSCFSSLSSPLNFSIRPDPESIFKLSLSVSIEELSNASLFVKQLKKKTTDVRSNGALRACETLLEDAVSRLGGCVSETEAGLGEKVLTEANIGNIQTWVSAAMADREMCLNGLEEMGSALLDEVRAKLERSNELMSNSLAIVAHLKDLREKFEKGVH